MLRAPSGSAGTASPPFLADRKQSNNGSLGRARLRSAHGCSERLTTTTKGMFDRGWRPPVAARLCVTDVHWVAAQWPSGPVRSTLLCANSATPVQANGRALSSAESAQREPGGKRRQSSVDCSASGAQITRARAIASSASASASPAAVSSKSSHGVRRVPSSP